MRRSAAGSSRALSRARSTAISAASDSINACCSSQRASLLSSDHTSAMAGREYRGITERSLEARQEVAGEVADKNVLDAALINAAQAAEHYEITRYGSLIAWAKQLGRNDCASVLQKTLEEEKATDQKLTQMAESKVNLRAAS